MASPQRQTILGGWRVALFDGDPPVLRFEARNDSGERFEAELDWHAVQQFEKTLIHAEALIRRRENAASE